jgi:membrane fusion protein (multidrug efflux system)
VGVALLSFLGAARSDEAPLKPPALEFKGYLTPVQRVLVSAGVQGQVAEVLVREGQQVKKGDVLARLDRARQQTDVREAQARLELAKARLAALGQVPAGQARVARAEVEVAQAQLERARLRLERTEVRAPFAGTILKLNVAVGSFTNPASAGLASTASICELADLSALEVEVHIHERNLARFFTGQKCEVRLDAFPDMAYRGVVRRLSPLVDRGSNTFTLWAEMEAPKGRALPVDSSAMVRFAPR